MTALEFLNSPFKGEPRSALIWNKFGDLVPVKSCMLSDTKNVALISGDDGIAVTEGIVPYTHDFEGGIKLYLGKKGEFTNIAPHDVGDHILDIGITLPNNRLWVQRMYRGRFR